MPSLEECFWVRWARFTGNGTAATRKEAKLRRLRHYVEVAEGAGAPLDTTEGTMKKLLVQWVHGWALDPRCATLPPHALCHAALLKR